MPKFYFTPDQLPYKTKRLNFQDISGQRFDRLTVLRAIGRYGTDELIWECVCKCGNLVECSSKKLRKGERKCCRSCSYHGQSNTKAHSTWRAIQSRCKDPKKYGAKGIRVCGGWRESFRSFYADMGDPPSPIYSIDRISPKGHYACGHCDECISNEWPANCRWATPEQQQENKSTVILLTINGETLTIKDWAKRSGLRSNTIWTRLKGNWIPSKIISTPSNRGNGRRKGLRAD